MKLENSTFEENALYRIEELILKTKLKETKTAFDQVLFSYLVSFINFRLSVLMNDKKDEKTKLKTLKKKEKKLSKHLTEEQIDSINLGLLYKDPKLKVSRKKSDLEELKKIIGRR